MKELRLRIPVTIEALRTKCAELDPAAADATTRINILSSLLLTGSISNNEWSAMQSKSEKSLFEDLLRLLEKTGNTQLFADFHLAVKLNRKSV